MLVWVGYHGMYSVSRFLQIINAERSHYTKSPRMGVHPVLFVYVPSRMLLDLLA